MSEAEGRGLVYVVVRQQYLCADLDGEFTRRGETFDLRENYPCTDGVIRTYTAVEVAGVATSHAAAHALVEAEAAERGDGRVRWDVQDSGHGYNPDDRLSEPEAVPTAGHEAEYLISLYRLDDRRFRRLSRHVHDA